MERVNKIKVPIHSEHFGEIWEYFINIICYAFNQSFLGGSAGGFKPISLLFYYNKKIIL